MADKLKAAKPGKAFEDKLAEIGRRLKEVNSQKEKAKEYNGLAAQKTKDATENLNINKWAFTATAQALKKEPPEQLDRVLTFFALALGNGLLDQADMFDDRLAYIRRKLDEMADGKAPAAPAPGAENVAALRSVN